MAKAWLFRPMPHNIDRMREFIDGDLVAIGWPQIGSLVGKNKQDIKGLLEQCPLNYQPNELGIATATVNTFVNEMRIGDYLVVPHVNDVYFCVMKGDYQYDSTKIAEGYPHQRAVKWQKGPVRRDDIPNELRKSLRAPRTLADLSHHLDAIIEFVGVGSSAQQNRPALDQDYVVFEYPVRLDTIARITIPKNITQAEASRLGDFVKTLYFG